MILLETSRLYVKLLGPQVVRWRGVITFFDFPTESSCDHLAENTA